jgi:hypothetical protein
VVLSSDFIIIVRFLLKQMSLVKDLQENQRIYQEQLDETFKYILLDTDFGPYANVLVQLSEADKGEQPEDQQLLRDVSDQITLLNKELAGIQQMVEHSYPDSLEMSKKEFSRIDRFLDAIHDAIATYHGEKIKPKLSEEEAIKIARQKFGLSDYYIVESESGLQNRSYSYGVKGPLYRFMFSKKDTPDFVVEISGLTGDLISYYDGLTHYADDKYFNQVMDEQLKTILTKVAREVTSDIPQKMKIFLPKSKKYRPIEDTVLLVNEQNGILNFSQVISLTINATEQKVYRYRKEVWSTSEISSLQPGLNKDELVNKLSKMYKFNRPKVGNLIITYSRFQEKPVLAYAVRAGDEFHIVNADTARSEMTPPTFKDPLTELIKRAAF